MPTESKMSSCKVVGKLASRIAYDGREHSRRTLEVSGELGFNFANRFQKVSLSA
jgi:hypothetical protein